MSESEAEMGEASVTKIPRFNGRRGEDYGLWRLRLRAACRIKGVWKLVESTSATTLSSSDDTTIMDAQKEKMTAKLEKASAMIISALGDSPLRVVADADGDPARMLMLLDTRYASNRTVSRIAVQTQLYRMRYKGQDMAKYIDEYTALFSQLEFMGKEVAIPETHKAPMLLASIDPSSDMEPIAAALRTKNADELTWEYVATTLIDEHNSRQSSCLKADKGAKRKKNRKQTSRRRDFKTDDGNSTGDESVDIDAAAKVLAAAMNDRVSEDRKRSSSAHCDFCNRRGHVESSCFLNPDNPNNRLTPKMRERMLISDDSRGNSSGGNPSQKKGSGKKIELAGIIFCTSSAVNKIKEECTTVQPPKDHRTYYDSGATTHVFYSEQFFIIGSIEMCEPRTVLLADKSTVVASKRGEVLLPFKHANIRLTSVLLIPGLGYNLVSVGRLADNGIDSKFRRKDVVLTLENDGLLIGTGTRDDETGLYALPDPASTNLDTVASAVLDEATLWHRRLAHMNAKDLRTIYEHAVDVPKLGAMKEICRACRMGKAHKLPFKGSFHRAEKVGDVVHSDIVGPLEPSFPDGYRYFVTFQDDYSRYDFIGLMHHKSDLLEVFKSFSRKFLEMGAGRGGELSVPHDEINTYKSVLSVIKRLHSDQAKEYIHLGNDLGEDVLKSYSPPYTPELNAIAERVNRTIADAARSILIQADLPSCLWPFAVKHVTYIRNRVPHSATNASPYLNLTGKKPSLKHARVFGCVTYVLKLPRGSKFEARAMEGTLLEVLDHGVYKVLIRDDSGSYLIVTSRHVTFDETRFLGVSNLGDALEEEATDDDTWSDDKNCDEVDLDFDIETSSAELNLNDDTKSKTHDTRNDSCADEEKIDLNLKDGKNAQEYPTSGDEDGKCSVDDEGFHDASDGISDAQNSLDEQTFGINSTGYSNEEGSERATHRYPRRIRNPPSKWFMVATSTNVEITTGDDPTLNEAMNATAEERELWLNAIDDEFKSIQENETWKRDDNPKGVPLPTHTVLQVKRDAKGIVDRFKARIVAGGNHQVYGENYSETYAPVVEFSLVRVFIYLVLSLGLFIAQVDIKTAFLNGALEEDVWVMSPRGIPGRPTRTYKLTKALYGLKQAHLAWHRKLTTDLKELGFNELPSAPCVFKKSCGSFFSFVLVYVDDLLVIAPTQEGVEQVIRNLEGLYKLRRSEKVELFLGVNIKWESSEEGNSTSVKMCQKLYIQSILRRFGMTNCKPAVTPMVEQFFTGLDAEQDKVPVNIELYQQIIGSLLYLALRTRPDIVVSVLILARFQKNPTGYCHRAAKRIMRYLKGTLHYNMVFHPGRTTLSAYVDSDYAGDTKDRKSMGGYIMKLDDAVVSWGARKQTSVALSTCEAEYFAMSQAAQEAFWMRKVLKEIGLKINTPTVLYSDNISAIAWAEGEKAPSKRAKHIDVRIHFVRDLVQSRDLSIKHVSSDSNDADVMTKPLGNIKLQEILKRIWLQAAVEEEC